VFLFTPKHSSYIKENIRATLLINGMNLYDIEIKRIAGLTELTNLTYNMFRKIQTLKWGKCEYLKNTNAPKYLLTND
jgi:hypothetical protein